MRALEAIPRPLTTDELPVIRARLASAGCVSVFLDFDGTLAPIAARPAEAAMDPRFRPVLERLCARAGFMLALISGRSLADVRERAGIGGAIYAGNHGLEISGFGMEFVEPIAAAKREHLAWLCRLLAGRLAGIPGAEVECKGLTASVHYRRASWESHALIARTVKEAIISSGSDFLLNQGKMVWEIMPRGGWHKGEAVKWIHALLTAEQPASVYVGDDRTDESAFQVLKDETTVRVGGPEPSLARYRVDDIEGVLWFLSWLSMPFEGDRNGGK